MKGCLKCQKYNCYWRRNFTATGELTVRITLEELLRESYRLLKTRGTFFMVHRPFRLAEIFSQMVSCRIEPKRMRLVYPFEDKEPNMVLIEGVKDGRSRLTVEPPLIVYESPGNYTEELKRMYYG